MKKIFFIFFLFSYVYAQDYRGGFIYEFHDASVPPQYHRSYFISIEDTNVMFRIDSYGDVLFEEKFSITGAELDKFKKEVKKCNIKYTAGTQEPNGCTGGTSDSFFIYWSDNDKQDGFTSKCGGKEYGNIKGKVEDLRNLFKNMVPDFYLKLQSTNQ